jgi:flavodoxin
MKALIVYFSRTGRTQKVAEAIASLTGSDLEEIREKRGRGGPLGWLRSGMESTRGMLPHIEPLGNDPASYDLVVIGTPIWASNASSPVRAFMKQYGDRIRKAAFFCTGDGSESDKAFKGQEELLGRKPQATLALLGEEREGDPAEAKIKEFVDSLKTSS